MKHFSIMRTVNYLLLSAISAFCWYSQNPQLYWGTHGEVEFSDLKISVNIHDGYADIEEEAYMVARFAGTDAHEIIGDFTLWGDAVITGAFLWNGDEIIKAKLKPLNQSVLEYDSITGHSTAPPPQPLDPIILKRTGDHSYSMSVYPVYNQVPRKVRIRYLVPIVNMGGVSQLLIPPAFYSGEESNPLLNVKGISSEVKVVTANQNMRLSAPFEIQLNQFLVQLEFAFNQKYGVLQTNFSSGDWLGNYLYLAKSVPDSLLNQLNTREELVCLWKWNFPELMKTISTWGISFDQTSYDAIAQSAILKEAFETVTNESKNVFVGLVHQPQMKTTNVFPLGNKGSQEFQDIEDYLNSIDLDFIANNTPIPPRATATADSNFIENLKSNMQISFDTLMAKSIHLFSKKSNTIRHIVVLISGRELQVATPSFQDLEDFNIPDSISVGVSQNISHNTWPGVNIEKLVEDHQYSDSLVGDYIPLPKPAQITYAASVKINGSNRFYMLDNDNSFVEVAEHSLENFGSSIDWSAYDQKGDVVANYSESIADISHASDTAIAKIVMGHSKAHSTVYEKTLLGPTYGILREDYALLGLGEDTLSSADKELYANGGLPYLTEDEVFVPEKHDPTDIQQELDQSKLAKEIGLNVLGPHRIQVSISTKLASQILDVQVTNLRGEKIGSLDTKLLKNFYSAVWFNPSSYHGVVVFQFKTRSGVISKRVSLIGQ